MLFTNANWSYCYQVYASVRKLSLSTVSLMIGEKSFSPNSIFILDLKFPDMGLLMVESQRLWKMYSGLLRLPSQGLEPTHNSCYGLNISTHPQLIYWNSIPNAMAFGVEVFRRCFHHEGRGFFSEINAHLEDIPSVVSSGEDSLLWSGKLAFPRYWICWQFDHGLVPPELGEIGFCCL